MLLIRSEQLATINVGLGVRQVEGGLRTRPGVIIHTWRREHYELRPKKSLGGLAPTAYAKTLS